MLADPEPIVRATAGATASAIKELMRRAVLAAILTAPEITDPTTMPVVDDDVMTGVLADYAAQRQALSRAVLGGGEPTGQRSVNPDGLAGDDDRPANWQWDSCVVPDQIS